MDEHSVGALFSAAKQGRVEELATLLDGQPELVHARSDPAHHHTLLILAAWHGRTPVAQLLLDRGADPNAVNLEGRTPLWFSCCGGHVDTAELLLRGGGDPSVRKEGGSTALMAAAWTGHLPVARLILDHAQTEGEARRLLDEQNKDGCSSLWFAAGHGRADMVAFLLSRGADFLLADCDGYTALHVARLRGYTDCAQLLEETERGYWLYQARKLYDDKTTLAALPRNGTRARYAQRRSSLTPTYLRRRADKGLPFPEPTVTETERPDMALLAALEAAAKAEAEAAAAAAAAAGGQEEAGQEEEEMVPQQKTPRSGGGRGLKRKSRSSSLGGGGGGGGGACPALSSSSSSSSSSCSSGSCSSGSGSRKRGSGAGLAAAEAAARAAAARAEAEAEERRQEVLAFVLKDLKAELFVELMAHFRARDPRLTPLQRQQTTQQGLPQLQPQQLQAPPPPQLAPVAADPFAGTDDDVPPAAAAAAAAAVVAGGLQQAA